MPSKSPDRSPDFSPDSSNDRRTFWSLALLLLCTLFLFYYKLGGVGLFDVDEAVYSEATREMVERGDWITPHYNLVNRYDKPIFFYWLMGGAYKLFGISEFSARFASAALGLLLVLFLYSFLRAIEHGRRTATAPQIPV